jgi:hypothetical protein
MNIRIGEKESPQIPRGHWKVFIIIKINGKVVGREVVIQSNDGIALSV